MFFWYAEPKFLQFVSKMSRGGLINDDNQVKETALPAPGDWASEYQQQYNLGDAWAGEFINNKACPISYSFASFLLIGL
jgi:peroxin-5